MKYLLYIVVLALLQGCNRTGEIVPKVDDSKAISAGGNYQGLAKGCRSLQTMLRSDDITPLQREHITANLKMYCSENYRTDALGADINDTNDSFNQIELDEYLGEEINKWHKDHSINH